MKARSSWVRRAQAASLAACAVLLCANLALSADTAPEAQAASASQPASAPVILPEEMPPAASFQAMDKPGDDGSAIVVTWARPAKESKDAQYVVEIARSPQDFGKTSLFRSKLIEPSPPELGDMYQTEFIPYRFFPPPEPPKLTADRLRALAAEKVILPDELARAQAILEGPRAAVSQPASAVSEPSTQSQPATAESQPASQSQPSSQSQPAAGPSREDKAWFASLRQYVLDRDWLKGFVTGDKRALTDAQLARALAALGSQFREEKTPSAKSEQGWLERLMGYLKEKDQDAKKDQRAAINRSTWYFRMAVVQGETKAYVSQDGRPLVRSAGATPKWFKTSKANNLVFSLVFCGIVFAFIEMAKRKPSMFIRKIGGLEAVDEAIGRSTEMDRPVFFIHGLGGMGDLATIASVNILSRVAQRTAEHDSRVRVMNNDPIVTAVSQEVVQQAYTQAGRPDAYNPDDVSLVASDQFAYVAAVSGIMVREQPGAIFLMGSFFAESLLLAETGASTGAIQVAGTDAYTQLPFFITTCDYTLIGEELYAASAYLSREPRMLGSLRGQDVGKAFLMAAIVSGSILLTVAVALGQHWNWLRNLFNPGQG